MDLEIKVLELYKHIQNIQDCLDEIETRWEISSNDTENLISEEVHWFVRVFKKSFAISTIKCNVTFLHTIIYDSDTYNSDNSYDPEDGDSCYSDTDT